MTAQLVIIEYTDDHNWEEGGNDRVEVIHLNFAMFNDEWGNYERLDYENLRDEIQRIEDPAVRQRYLDSWQAEWDQWLEFNEDNEALTAAALERERERIRQLTRAHQQRNARPAPTTLHTLTRGET